MPMAPRNVSFWGQSGHGLRTAWCLLVTQRVREQHRKWCYGQTNYAVSTSSANFLRA